MARLLLIATTFAVTVAFVAVSVGGAAPVGFVSNRAAGIAVRYPTGWYIRLSAHLNAQIMPNQERLIVASYPIRSWRQCVPRWLAQLPPKGAVLDLEEWSWRGVTQARLQRSDFPPRPSRFRLGHAQFGNFFPCGDNISYYRFRFRAAHRPFDLFVVFGRRATPARRQQMLRILDNLKFSRRIAR